MITPEENSREKATFCNTYLPSFTQYLDIDKLEQKIPNYRYLNDELNKLEQTTTPSVYQHVMSKKKIITFKKCKTIMS